MMKYERRRIRWWDSSLGLEFTPKEDLGPPRLPENKIVEADIQEQFSLEPLMKNTDIILKYDCGQSDYRHVLHQSGLSARKYRGFRSGTSCRPEAELHRLGYKHLGVFTTNWCLPAEPSGQSSFPPHRRRRDTGPRPGQAAHAACPGTRRPQRPLPDGRPSPEDLPRRYQFQQGPHRGAR